MKSVVPATDKLVASKTNSHSHDFHDHSETMQMGIVVCDHDAQQKRRGQNAKERSSNRYTTKKKKENKTTHK